MAGHFARRGVGFFHPFAARPFACAINARLRAWRAQPAPAKGAHNEVGALSLGWPGLALAGAAESAPPLARRTDRISIWPHPRFCEPEATKAATLAQSV